MLKESYYPRWTATVGNEAVKTQMLAPSFVGVPYPPERISSCSSTAHGRHIRPC